MKIIILHGNHEIKSYQRLQTFCDEAKKRSWDTVRVNINNFTFAETLSSRNLFGGNRFVILEDIRQLSKKDLDWLKKNSKNADGTLVIYHRGLINKTTLNSLPKPDKIEEFKLPTLIWSFLDSVYPKNSKNVLLLLHEIVKTEPVELVFYFLVKHLRDLYWVKVDKDSAPYSGWRLGKLKGQSSRFDEKLLKDLINDLSVADIKSKTSNSNLVDLLDFIIVTKLE